MVSKPAAYEGVRLKRGRGQGGGGGGFGGASTVAQKKCYLPSHYLYISGVNFDEIKDLPRPCETTWFHIREIKFRS